MNNRRSENRRARQERRRARYEVSADAAAMVFGAVAFFVVAYLSLRNLDIPFYKMGAGNLAVVLAMVFVSVLLSSIAVILLIDKQIWSAKVAGVFASVMLMASLGIYDGILYVVDSRFPLAESLVEARVTHHCLTDFDPGRCADQIALCPQCVQAIPRAQRLQVADKLDLFLVKVEAHGQAQEAAASQGGPLTEAAETWRKENRRPAAH